MTDQHEPDQRRTPGSADFEPQPQDGKSQEPDKRREMLQRRAQQLGVEGCEQMTDEQLAKEVSWRSSGHHPRPARETPATSYISMHDNR